MTLSTGHILLIGVAAAIALLLPATIYVAHILDDRDPPSVYDKPRPRLPIAPENITITYGYSIDALRKKTETPDRMTAGIEAGFAAWTESNPHMQFKFSEDDPDIWVNMFKSLGSNTAGYACMDCLGMEPSITLGIYGIGCGGLPGAYSATQVRNTVAHEIGHILGLPHVSTESHLMFIGHGHNTHLYDFPASELITDLNVPEPMRGC